MQEEYFLAQVVDLLGQLHWFVYIHACYLGIFISKNVYVGFILFVEISYQWWQIIIGEFNGFGDLRLALITTSL